MLSNQNGISCKRLKSLVDCFSMILADGCDEDEDDGRDIDITELIEKCQIIHAWLLQEKECMIGLKRMDFYLV